MNERGIIADALIEYVESLEYFEKRLIEVGNSNRTVRQNIKQGIQKSSTKMEAFIELAYALGIITEEESRMEPGMLIEQIETEC